jgi:hypothetical protein
MNLIKVIGVFFLFIARPLGFLFAGHTASQRDVYWAMSGETSIGILSPVWL